MGPASTLDSYSGLLYQVRQLGGIDSLNEYMNEWMIAGLVHLSPPTLDDEEHELEPLEGLAFGLSAASHQDSLG